MFKCKSQFNFVKISYIFSVAHEFFNKSDNLDLE
jgi:hypothetical protein